MRTDIIEYLQKEVYTRCESPNNEFGVEIYYHIEAVVKNAKLLADKNSANKEVVIIAAWLHDIASITDYSLYKMHHVHGADMAYDILIKFNYDIDKISLVQECIKNHRGSVVRNKITNEEMCIADADAISHLDNIPSLLYLAYVTKGMGCDEGKKFVREKIDRSYSKLSQDSKDYYIEKYHSVVGILG